VKSSARSPETIQDTDDLASGAERAYNQKQLVRFMAEVGYSTYKDDKIHAARRIQRQSILDPTGAYPCAGSNAVRFHFLARLAKWKGAPALVDSINRATDSLMPVVPLPKPKPKHK
jgi:hypothetical protein